MTTASARTALGAWLESYPADPFEGDRLLRNVLAASLEEGRLVELEQRAGAFARQVTSVVGPAAARYEQRLHLPELARYDAIGRRTESVEFDPAYDEAGAAVWASGLVALSGDKGRAYEQATLLYLLSLEGEAGHACPATCTIGLARALRRVADGSVRERFLPPLLESDYGGAVRGSQFLTEVQGGSDVGANTCSAEPTGDGQTYRITGEKWFCSVADAGQFFLTARVPGGPEGTRGLGSFLVPRTIGTEPNGLALRRLKDKLGTRGLASGEIDFDGALAWPIGPLEHGFRTAVGIVLNTSRWMTAIGAAGMMRRALLEATAYARHREAFGQTIDHFPAVRRTLADMAAGAAGALHLSFALTGFEDALDAGEPSEEEVALHRFFVNATKYLTSRQATTVVRSAIEILGGNGTIEEFSVLPRLYRDAIVYESWEGTHNVLVAQVLNDLRRLPLLEVVEAWLGELVGRAGPGELGTVLSDSLEQALASTRRAMAEVEFGAWHFRDALGQLALIAEVGCLLERGELDLAAHLALPELQRGYRAESDDRLADRVDAVVKAVR